MTSEIRSELEELTREQLMDRIVEMKSEIVKVREDYAKIIHLRLYHLERSQILYIQYGRRETFEIAGTPTNIKDEDLEDEVIDIAMEANVMVNRQPLKKSDISAAHRLKSGKTVIIRVVNRKYFTQAKR